MAVCYTITNKNQEVGNMEHVIPTDRRGTDCFKWDLQDREFVDAELIQNFPRQLHLEHQNGISHLVKAEPDSIVGRTNSHHRDGITETGSDISITARSADGIPEAIEHRTLPCFGVQWHPERQRGDSMNPSCGPDMTPLFTYFVNLCRKGN